MPQLREHQIATVNTAANKWGLFFRMRVGKTATAIALAQARTTSALIVCPKSLVGQWEREIKVWGDKTCNFYVVSKETLRREWNGLPKVEAIIIDECHLAFANYKNQAFKAADKYIAKHNVEYIWLLTGTPFTSSSWSIYSYGKLLGKDWSWHTWFKRYFYQVKMGSKMIPMAKKNMDAELQTIIRRIGTVIDLKDVADVPDDEDIVETFEMNADQKKLIKDSFDPLPIVRFTKQHMIESGVLKGNAYEQGISIDVEKDKRIMEYVENTDKLIIVCRYISQIDKYDKMISSTGKKVYRISGQEKMTASEVALLAEQATSAVVLIQGDTVAGYNLQSFDTVIFASMSYSFVNYDQLRYRTKNMEKKVPCTYIHFITEGESVDRAVYEAVQRKQDFSIELFSKKV